ncbi:MAG TPA: response regulator [Stellaceae bacterium]|nr:response regulator [Stellaceae bacterium]
MNAMNAVRKVLVVDDDPVIGKSFDRVLARKGYLVVNAENGQEALNKIAKEDYDAVFTDIKMPGMDGLEVAERVRAKRPWTPVVIITGYGSADHEARAAAAGVSGFLRKPLSPEMIERSLDAAVATALPPPAEMLPQLAVAVAPEPAGTALTAPQPAALGEESAGRTIGLFLRNIAMLFAAPFVALAYVALFPLIGLGMLVWTGVQAWRERQASLAALQPAAVGEEGAGMNIGLSLYNIAMFFAAPFVTLTYIALFPLIGLAVLVWMGAQAWRNRRALG